MNIPNCSLFYRLVVFCVARSSPVTSGSAGHLATVAAVDNLDDTAQGHSNSSCSSCCCWVLFLEYGCCCHHNGVGVALVGAMWPFAFCFTVQLLLLLSCMLILLQLQYLWHCHSELCVICYCYCSVAFLSFDWCCFSCFCFRRIIVVVFYYAT